MLLKLIKYDFKATYAKMLSTLALYAVITILVPFIIFPFNNTASTIYVTIAFVIASIALAAIITIFIFQHYSKNLYSSEGYLMSTLPTNGYMLLLSKFITAFIWDFITFVFQMISLVVFGMIYYKTIPDVRTFIEKIMQINTLPDILSGLFTVIITMTVSSILVFMTIYLSISVSKLQIFGKFGNLLGVVTFFAVTIIENIPLNIIDDLSTTNTQVEISSVSDLINNSMFLNFNDFLWITNAIDLVFGVALFFLTGYLIDKKTSLK